MQLKKLEDAVGHRLLERDARKQHLTPEGETLLGYARRILELHAEAHDALNGDALTGRVRLGVPDDYAARYLTPVLKRFAPRYAGVDIELRRSMWTFLTELNKKGITIILTTHYIEEAEDMADRVGVINRGELVLVEDKRTLMRKLGKKQLALTLQAPLPALPAALAAQCTCVPQAAN